MLYRSVAAQLRAAGNATEMSGSPEYWKAHGLCADGDLEWGSFLHTLVSDVEGDSSQLICNLRSSDNFKLLQNDAAVLVYHRPSVTSRRHIVSSWYVILGDWQGGDGGKGVNIQLIGKNHTAQISLLGTVIDAAKTVRARCAQGFTLVISPDSAAEQALTKYYNTKGFTVTVQEALAGSSQPLLGMML
jgi:hypothetical protein